MIIKQLLLLITWFKINNLNINNNYKINNYKK